MTLLLSASEAIKICQQRAIDKSRQLDPTLARTVRIACGRYFVDGNGGEYTVTVDATGYHCTCEGAKHPACWHRASTYRLRIVERARRGMVAPVAASSGTVKTSVPTLESLYAGLKGN